MLNGSVIIIYLTYFFNILARLSCFMYFCGLLKQLLLYGPWFIIGHVEEILKSFDEWQSHGQYCHISRFNTVQSKYVLDIALRFRNRMTYF